MINVKGTATVKNRGLCKRKKEPHRNCSTPPWRVYAAVVMDLCAIYIALNKLEFSNSALTQAQLIEN